MSDYTCPMCQIRATMKRFMDEIEALPEIGVALFDDTVSEAYNAIDAAYGMHKDMCDELPEQKGAAMRMWMIPPSLLCQKHLLGEHGEIHKHRHNFEKRHSIAGRIAPIVLIEPASMQSRHDALAAEMTRRGYNHASPYTLPDLSYLGESANVKADIAYNVADLCGRCAECARNFAAVQLPPADAWSYRDAELAAGTISEEEQENKQ